MWIPTPQQAWTMPAGAIVLEVATTRMRLSEGFTRLTPAVLIVVFSGASFALATLVIRSPGLSVVCALWPGAGRVLTACVGLLWLEEPATAPKLVGIGLTLIGVMGLHASIRGLPA